MRTRQNQRNRACRWTLQFTCSLIVLALSSPAIAIEPGQKAPNFRAKKLEGKGTLGLSQYRGKVVYLDFWASWCAPCLEAVPALEALRGEFPESKFQILAVNVDKETRNAIIEVGFRGRHYGVSLWILAISFVMAPKPLRRLNLTVST